MKNGRDLMSTSARIIIFYILACDSVGMLLLIYLFFTPALQWQAGYVYGSNNQSRMLLF